MAANLYPVRCLAAGQGVSHKAFGALVEGAGRFLIEMVSRGQQPFSVEEVLGWDFEGQADDVLTGTLGVKALYALWGFS